MPPLWPLDGICAPVPLTRAEAAAGQGPAQTLAAEPRRGLTLDGGWDTASGGACVQDLVFHYWADRDLRVAFSTHPESQASSRGEAKDSALLSSRDAGLLKPPERPQGPPVALATVPLWSHLCL